MNKKVMSIFLAVLLILGSMSGCGKTQKEKQETKETAMGRFLEEEVVLPKRIKRIDACEKLSDGSLLLLGIEDRGIRKLYLSKDQGKSWEEQKIADRLKKGEDSYLYQSAISPTGQIYGSLSNKEGGFDDWIFDKEGGERKLKIELPAVKNAKGTNKNFVTGAVFSENGNLFIKSLQSDICQVDVETGKIIKNLNENGESVVLMEAAGNRIFLVNQKKVSIFDAEKGEELKEDKVLTKELTKNILDTSTEGISPILLAGGSEDGIFFATHSGIYYHTPGGSVVEQLVNGELNTIGNPNIGLNGMWVLDQDHFLIAVVDEEGSSKLLQYTYSKNTPAMPEKELTVYSLQDSDEIRQAISVFQKENQDIYVNFQIGMDGEEGITANDALRTLNTNIMAGKGPDVLVLDGMPVDSYIEKGLLADVSSIKEQIKKQDGVFENMMKPYEKGNKLYAMPSRFLVPFLQGNEEVLKGSGNIKKLAETAKLEKERRKGKNVVPEMNAETLLQQMYDADSANWFTKGDKIEEQKLTNFFESVKTLYEINPKKRNDNEKMDGKLKTIGTGGCLSMASNQISMNLGTLGTAVDIQMMASSNPEGEKVDYELLCAEEKKSFIPNVVLGMNSKSKRKEEAEAFLKTALGKKVNMTPGSGFPINRAAYEHVTKEAVNTTGGGISVYSDDGIEISMEVLSAKEQDIKKLTQIIESLDTAALTDDGIKEMIISQGKKYLEDSQSVQETVKNVMQKISLYLSE